jgi:hypothetical protein
MVRKESKVRAIRLPMEIDRALRGAAAEKRVSVNALGSEILIKFVERDRMMEKIGDISMSSSLFKAMLDKISELDIEAIAKESSSDFIKEALLAWYGAVNLNTLLSLMSMASRYGHRIIDMETRIVGKQQIIMLHHDFGEKWSKFLAVYWGNAIEMVLHVKPQVEIGSSFASLTFPASIVKVVGGGLSQALR